MNPEGGCQQGAPSSNPQRMLEDELLRTRELFQNFVTAMQPMSDVLTPEQRMLLANRTGNPGPIVPPVPIASAPMQHNLGNISGAAHHGAPAPQQILPPGLPPLPIEHAQVLQHGHASGYGGGGSPSSSSFIKWIKPTDITRSLGGAAFCAPELS